MQDLHQKINNLIIQKFFKKPDVSNTSYSFSENGSDALLVIEELHRREDAIFLVNARDENNKPIWIVGNNTKSMIESLYVIGRMPENGSFSARAATMPMAVCLAALKSIGVDPYEGT